ncbi:GDYXXLXY domain-containing protein [Metabacillus indicus]|uniref:GDYXXLXY domain-containing protein n=1 Tax=Metabacillus indicus TaxID=246786 RepID=UPI003CFB9456
MKKTIPLGYAASIIFILSGIIFFFASNWGGFERTEKTALAAGIIILFYGASFLFGKWMKRPELTRWLLVGGAVSFGAAVALIGQIYNSHADSYLLFVIWLIPSLMFAVITRYQPFAILSYVLFMLSYWFYLYPSSIFLHRTEFEQLLIYLGIVLLNGVVFFLARSLGMKVLEYCAFAVVHLFLIIMSFYYVFETYSLWMNVLFLAVLLFSYFSFMKKAGHQALTFIGFTMAGIFVLSKYIEMSIRLSDQLGGLSFYFFTILLALIFLGAGIFAAVKAAKQASSDSAAFKVSRNILIVIITFTSSILLSSSLAGLLYLIFESSYALAIVSMVFLILAAVLKTVNPAARYTLFITGFLSALGVITIMDTAAVYLFLIAGAVILLIEREGFLQFLAYSFVLALLLNLFSVHFEWADHFRVILAALSLIQFVLLLIPFKPLRKLDSVFLAYGFLLLYPAAFWGTDWRETLVYQILYFGLNLAALVIYQQKEEVFKRNAAWVFFILFLTGLYYDFAWKLLHKSVTFLIIGVVLFAAASYFDREKRAGESAFSKMRWAMIAAVVLLQLGFTGYQSVANETALKEGTSVILELEPLDPRSVMQGDYVQLRYEAGRFEGGETMKSGTVVTVKVKKDSAGVFRPEGEPVIGRAADMGEPELDTVYLTGIYNGYDSVHFGIESFFVEEGTGLELERSAKYAKVIVSHEGNALLTDVKKDLSSLK